MRTSGLTGRRVEAGGVLQLRVAVFCRPRSAFTELQHIVEISVRPQKQKR